MLSEREKGGWDWGEKETVYFNNKRISSTEEMRGNAGRPDETRVYNSAYSLQWGAANPGCNPAVTSRYFPVADLNGIPPCHLIYP